jgi:hypothetical protein
METTLPRTNPSAAKKDIEKLLIFIPPSRLQFWVSSCGICGGQNSTGALP